AVGGYTVDFVGSGANGPPELGDHDHEGHSGWRIDQLDANIVGWLRTSAPHTVLLHIGTNDVNQNLDLANAPARLSTLVDHILATARSEERRVGKECRCCGWADHKKKKKAKVRRGMER